MRMRRKRGKFILVVRQLFRSFNEFWLLMCTPVSNRCEVNIDRTRWRWNECLQTFQVFFYLLFLAKLSLIACVFKNLSIVSSERAQTVYYRRGYTLTSPQRFGWLRVIEGNKDSATSTYITCDQDTCVDWRHVGGFIDTTERVGQSGRRRPCLRRDFRE